MKNSNTRNQRIAKMTFSSVYPLYLTKIEKKGRTREELHQVIEWLTSFDQEKLHNTLRATQNLLHVPALGQLIHQLI